MIPRSTTYTVGVSAATGRYNVCNRGPAFKDGTSLREARKECKRLNREALKSPEPCASTYQGKACNRALGHVEPHRS